jgi:Zn-dependent peptidase ImmA (M78 family)
MGMKRKNTSLTRIDLQNPYASLNDLGEFDYYELQAKQSNHGSLNNSKQNSQKLKDNLKSPISLDRYIKQNPYAHITSEGLLDYVAGNVINLNKVNPHKKARYSDHEIEAIVRKLQKQIWHSRKQNYDKPLDLLNPSEVLINIGYEVLDDQHDNNHLNQMNDVAGYIDSNRKIVSINRSSRFSREVQNFTLAHELGHAILHQDQAVGMHRDKPFDGSYKRTGIELDADKFATKFLMPQKMLKLEFKNRFLTNQWHLDETTAFAFGRDLNELKKMSYRDLSKQLAKANFYNGIGFISLAAMFKVSIEAMAIRIEELKLIR